MPNYYAVLGCATIETVPAAITFGWTRSRVRSPPLRFVAMKTRRAIIAAALALAAMTTSVALAQPAAAPSVADFYRGKTITYNLAVPDGASWGLYARTFIEHLRKHVPGNPTIILQVMPGGGGVAAANHIFNVAARDGTVIGTPLSTTMVFAATDPKEVLYDPRKFSWIGSLAVVQDVISVWHTAPAKTIDEAKKVELIMGATGKGSNTFQDIALANNLLGTKFKPVRGYKGGAEINIAIERGEVHGRSTTWESWPGSHPHWLREKKLIHLAQLGPRKLAEIGDDVPLLRELVKEGEERAIVDFIGLSLAMGRSVYAPPGIPADRLAALRAALIATVQDPAYIADAKRFALDADTWQPGEVIEKLMGETFTLPPALIEKAKAAIDLP
jgi:tripartite-type tricarboxylate transporter receptor subunit TctC